MIYGVAEQNNMLIDKNKVIFFVFIHHQESCTHPSESGNRDPDFNPQQDFFLSTDISHRRWQ